MMDAETAEAFRHSLRHAFRHDDVAAVDAALARAGWLEALEAVGVAVVPLVFAEQGAANATSTALDDLLVAALAPAAEPGAALVLPALTRTAPPGLFHEHDAVAVAGLGTTRMTTAKTAVVVATDGPAQRAVSVDAHRLRTRPITGIDPRLGLVAVEGVVPAARSTAPAVDWEQALSIGQVALAHELIGTARTMLRLAREHATTRIQFGRPIGRFQAVRHRLADSLIALECADAAAGSAVADAVAAPAGGPLARVSPQLAGMAKALAGRNARVVARHCQQVLAGVGFTAEHDFHTYFRRAVALDNLLGDAGTLTRDLGNHLLTTHSLPAPPL